MTTASSFNKTAPIHSIIQLIEEANPDVADMPKETIHPITYRRRGLLASRC